MPYPADANRGGLASGSGLIIVKGRLRLSKRVRKNNVNAFAHLKSALWISSSRRYLGVSLFRWSLPY